MASLHGTIAEQHAHCPSAPQEQKSTPPGPLSLPEVLSTVGSFLTVNSLTVCLRVSRTWYDTFLPWLWCEFNLELRMQLRNMPPVEAVRTHAALIRQIGITGARGNPFLHQLTYPNVSTLRLQANNYYARNDDLDESFQFMDTFPRLQRLELDGMMLDNYEMWFPQRKGTWSRLKSLSLLEPWFRSRLDRDRVVEYPSDKDAIPEIQHGALQEWHGYDKETRSQMFIIAQCSNLIRLQWRWTRRSLLNPESLKMMDWIAKGARQYWPSLHSLSLPFQDFPPESFRTLVESMTRLEELDLMHTNFDSQCWSILLENRRHLSTLRILDLSACHQLPGPCILAMLTLIPNLNVFKAGSVEKADRLDFATPWACHSLKELTLGLTVKDQSLCAALFSRLSEMQRLEYLEFCDLSSFTGTRLRMTLQNGLGQLATLRRMRILKGHQIQDVCWGVEEARWVLENWPSMTELRWISLNSAATQMLELNGIVVKGVYED